MKVQKQISTEIFPALIASLILLSVFSGSPAYSKNQPHETLSLENHANPAKARQAVRGIAYFNQAIALSPNDANLYVERGNQYNLVRSYQKAATDFSRAIALKPKLPDAYLGRAWANDQLDNFAAAESDYKKFMSFGPSPMYEMAAFSLADNLGQQGKTGEAKQVLNDMIKRNPKAGQPRRLRGLLENGENGNSKLAVEDFTVAITSKTEYWQECYGQRAEAYKRLKDYAKAVADYSEILKLSPNDDNNYRKRAAVYELMGEYKKAVADYSTGIARSLESAGPLYFARARCYKKLGLATLAQNDLDECKRINYSGK